MSQFKEKELSTKDKERNKKTLKLCYGLVEQINKKC